MGPTSELVHSGLRKRVWIVLPIYHKQTTLLPIIHKQPTYFHCTLEFIQVPPPRELNWLLHYSLYEM
jgi:hypothetical protein